MSARHWQADGRRLSAWLGVAVDRFMVGAVVNRECASLGVGLGPIYFGVGLIRG